MRVELRSAAYRVPTERPEADGTFAWDATTVVVVRASADGVVGTGWTYGAAAAGAVVDEVLAPVVGDGDPVAASERMSRALRNVGRPGIGATALSAVDIALWDLAARRERMPLAALLGRVRGEVPVYGSGGFTSWSDAQLATQLDGWLGAGIRDVKIKIGEDRGRRVHRDLTRVAFARRHVGSRVRVFVDANGAYGVEQAIEVGAALAEHRVGWFEEPVTSDDPQGLSRVRGAVPMDVAAGEYVWRRADAEALLHAHAVDCLQLDVTRCGGVTGWRDLAALAERAGLEVSAHCAPQLSAHVGAATPNLRHLEWFSDHEHADAALFDGVLPVRGGSLTPGDGPGHGMTLSDRAERYRV